MGEKVKSQDCWFDNWKKVTEYKNRVLVGLKVGKKIGMKKLSENFKEDLMLFTGPLAIMAVHEEEINRAYRGE